MTTTEIATRDSREKDVSRGVPPAPSPRITPETIQDTVQTISLLQGMVRDILVRGIDYGRIPGTPQDSLWDPGASQITGSFNCYAGERRILKLEDTDEKIVACIEVPVISRATQQVVGSGVGAASTLETKYKYRWVPNPKEWGYDDQAIKTFKSKPGKDDDGNDITLYRIPNPEHSELLNTIVKMASKRAEVDAAESLPGVASALRQIFSARKGRTAKTERGEYEGPVWQRFWGEVRRLGLTDQEAHLKLGVTSMKEWLASGRTLDQALDILRGRRETREPPDPDGGDVSEDEQGPPPDMEKPAPIIPKPSKEPVFKTWAELAEAAAKLGIMPSAVFKRRGYKNWEDFTSFRDAWGIVEEIVDERAQKPKMI